MRRWGVRARNVNVLIVVSLFGVFVVQALMVSRNIAQYESQGLGPSNDLGQRGLLVGVVVVLVAWGLAAFSNSGLARTVPQALCGTHFSGLFCSWWSVFFLFRHFYRSSG